MRHKLLYILTVILLCGVTVSCSKDKHEHIAGETVIMFFPYSGLENYIEENITCMKEAIVKRGGLGNTRLIVYQSTSLSNGLLYEIEYDQGRCQNRIISDVSATFQSRDQQSNIVQMESVFNKIKSTAPAASYSMIIGSHGNAWVQAGNTLATKGQKAFGSGTRSYQIDNTSLATALKNCGIHLTYLLFDACYMASVEAVYDFRNTCSYYIASQNEILLYGIPYDHVGDALLKHDYKTVVDNYYDFYSNYSIGTEKYPYGSLSVISTANLENFTYIIKELNRNLSPDADLRKVQFMDGIQPHIFFDMKDYYRNYCTDAKLYETFDAVLGAIVMYERHTDEFFTAYADYSPYHFPTIYSCGLNISQPTTNDNVAALLRQTEWWQATH